MAKHKPKRPQTRAAKRPAAPKPTSAAKKADQRKVNKAYREYVRAVRNQTDDAVYQGFTSLQTAETVAGQGIDGMDSAIAAYEQAMSAGDQAGMQAALDAYNAAQSGAVGGIDALDAIGAAVEAGDIDAAVDAAWAAAGANSTKSKVDAAWAAAGRRRKPGPTTLELEADAKQAALDAELEEAWRQAGQDIAAKRARRRGRR